jgi:hypothetical protein
VEKSSENVFRKPVIEATCECGRPILRNECGTNYTIVKRDKSGTVVFAVCAHGYTVVDRGNYGRD